MQDIEKRVMGRYRAAGPSRQAQYTGEIATAPGLGRGISDQAREMLESPSIVDMWRLSDPDSVVTLGERKSRQFDELTRQGISKREAAERVYTFDERREMGYEDPEALAPPFDQGPITIGQWLEWSRQNREKEWSLTPLSLLGYENIQGLQGLRGAQQRSGAKIGGLAQ